MFFRSVCCCRLTHFQDNPDAVQFPEDAPCSKEAKQFIKALLNPIAAKRPSASDALQHPWMMKHHLDDDEDLDSSVNEIWESFKQLRIATMSEDPEERRKQRARIHESSDRLSGARLAIAQRDGLGLCRAL